MSFDKNTNTNTITLDEKSDFLVDTGVFFMHVLRQESQAENASDKLIKDWRVIENWLGCKNSEITFKEEAKIGIGWKAYLAIGLAPSFELQPAFDHYSKQYKDSGYSFKEDKPPAEVMDVFDRSLAKDEELSIKRKYDEDTLKNKLKAILKKLPKKKLTFKQRLSTLSKNTRMFFAVSVSWCVWVVFRTSNYWEILGIDLDRWDSDMFFANVTIPILIVWLSFKAYKWINGSHN
jgi:hypothetical protein